MKITRNKRSVTIACTDLEFEILGIAVDQIEAGDPYELLYGQHIRRLWNIRTKDGPFLRVDVDRRNKPLSRRMRRSVSAMHTARDLLRGWSHERDLESKAT